MGTANQTKVGQSVVRLIDAAAAIRELTPEEAGQLRFIARIMTLAGLPHRDPGTHHYVRRNGDFQLTMVDIHNRGLPYGVIPRLLLAWVTTEAVRTQSRVLLLGDTLSGFLRELGMVPTGGRWGTITRVRKQVERLFTSAVGIRYGPASDKGSSMHSSLIAGDLNLWWDKDPNQRALWDSSVTLTEEFYREITEYPVPIDMRVLRALTKSPMAIDVYLWLTYRSSYLNKPVHISWEQLQFQFGAGYAADRAGRSNFQQAFKRAARKVKTVYPGANFELQRGRVVLFPGETSVPRMPE